MNQKLELVVKKWCSRVGNDRTRLLEVLRGVQKEWGHVPDEAIDAVASLLNVHRVEVEGLVTFYAFLSKEPRGKTVIRLCKGCVDEMHGMDRIAKVFSEELGIPVGGTTPDGKISLERTNCMGMCDQAPAALVNETLVPWLSTDKVKEIVRALKADPDPSRIVTKLGDGNNAHPLVRSMVVNNIRRPGPVVFAPMENGKALKAALSMHPAEVIRDIKTARLRGRGGAGFPTGLKWEFTRAAKGFRKFVVCNADEGEPGTFKDRVILTERPHMVFEGMTIGGWAIGADQGILYLRGEYAYLVPFLEEILEERRKEGLLGKNICGKEGFNFDIRVYTGAGAYICGEETALINSLEGKRGDPRNRPPFPAQKGFLDAPTTVNNVETFCKVARILEKGPGWFAGMGTPQSTGTKVLSVSGDIKAPGVYEVPFGITLNELLREVGGEDAKAVQVGGASGCMVPPSQFERKICFDDLATGGSIMVFGPHRDLLEIVENFLDFFVEESCGFCTPCRVGNVLLRRKIREIRAGKGEPGDREYLQNLGTAVKATARCGLGQTSPNPVLTTLEGFPELYPESAGKEKVRQRPAFDLSAALEAAGKITGRNRDATEEEA